MAPVSLLLLLLLLPLVLVLALVQCAHGFLVPYAAPSAAVQPQPQPQPFLKAAPSLEARRALLMRATVQVEQGQQQRQQQRQQQQRRQPSEPLADRRCVRCCSRLSFVCVACAACYHTTMHRKPVLVEWADRSIDQTHKHASDLLAAGAGIAAAGSWVLTAGAAATTTTIVAAPAAKPAAAGAATEFLCDDAISHLRDRKTGKEIYLIGTAHISNASAQVRGRGCGCGGKERTGVLYFTPSPVPSTDV
jgi:hypothetical protein